ncbi:hypothetical protein [Xanthomonas campestris]|uniref:hypothetical protein n=1 Tax=Xanthomonas campestris TaxID=339 RepID=UPI001F36A455|nr:hypothetical protein [Xanthomonas campestris]
MTTSLTSILENARNQSGAKVHYDANDNVRAAYKTGTAVAGEISLLGPVPANLATYFREDGTLRETPAGRPSVSSFLLDPLTIAAAHSRAAVAGAHLLIREDAIAPRPIGAGPDLPVMQRETSGFSVIKPMQLAVVADGANAAVSTALPVWSATVDWDSEATSPLSARRSASSVPTTAAAPWMAAWMNCFLHRSWLASAVLPTWRCCLR